MKTTTCPICRKTFSPPSQKPNQIYCCRECWRQSKVKQVERICETCGVTFSVYQARSDARFCSWACRSAQAEMTCEYCGATYYVKRAHAHKRRTCSRSCSAKLQARENRSPWSGRQRPADTKQKVSDGLKRFYAATPDKHWNYRNGPFSQRRGLHSSWQDTRKEARLRDNYACRICGINESALGKQLSVHHIRPFRFFAASEEANHLDNLICVCQSCHMKLEHGTVNLPTQSPD